ncbi:MAG: hypothetical protein NZ908_03260, partial [Candidatus Micrarchaeota archaeon]|nr:hypothetical protein [Candidatus Micrarchaeota archaeon]
HRNISTNASNSTNFKNLIIGYISPGNTTISIFWDHPIDGVVYFVYRNALFRSISTNRSLYKGYIDGVVIDIENNHPESYLYIEGISLEAWNASGKVADLLSKVIDLPINARGKISINLSFYIPENLPDSYLKIKIYRKHVLEGLSITDRSNEGLGRRIMDVLRMNYSEFLPITIYRAELPYYGIVGGNRMMYLDINAYTRMRCTLMDQNLNIIRTGVLNDSVQYIYFVCNNSVVRGIEVFDTIEIDFKNITDPPLLPIELIPETNIYENNVNRVRYRIINRMLYPIRVDAILVKLFNSTASFEILIRNTGMLEPGDLSRYVDLYIPGVPYDRYSLLLATIMEYDMAGQGSVLDRTYRSELPVQRIKYDSVNWLYLWKDPKTKYSISLRRPSTICGDENSDNGAIVFSINNNTQIRHVGNKYKCSCDF